MSAETASFQADMGRASQIALNSSKNIERSFTMMGAAATAAIGTAVGALGLLIEKTQDTVFQMQKMAQTAGVSMEAFSKLAYAAKTAGMPVDQMAVMLTRISHTSFEAASGNKMMAAAYKELGVNVTDANGHFKSSADLMVEMSKAFNTFRDSSGKTGLEVTLMGRSGAQAATLMNVLANRFGEVSEKAQRLGVVFNSDVAKNAQDLHDRFIDLQEAAFGMSVRLLSNVAPALDQVVDKVINFVSKADNLKKIDQIGGDIAKGISLAGDAIEFIINHFDELKIVVEGLLAVRMAGMFGPMIASAASATDFAGKLGKALLNLTGTMLGVKNASGVAATVAQLGSTLKYEAQYTALLASEQGVATAATYAWNGALTALRSTLGTLSIALTALTAGALIFKKSMEDNRDEAEKMAHTAVTWADEWHGAIDNVKEDFHDLGMIMAAITQGNFAALKEVHWTSLPEAAANEAKKRQAKEMDQIEDDPDGLWNNKKHVKDVKALPTTTKVDQLQKRLDELRAHAEAAQEAFKHVGDSPEQQRSTEVAGKLAEFQAEQKENLDKLSLTKRKAALDDAQHSFSMLVNAEAATKYAKAVNELNDSLNTSTTEHKEQADAVGKSAQAMQDAIIAAKVSQEMLKLGGPNWQQDTGMLYTAYELTQKHREEMNAANEASDKQSLASTTEQIEAQQRLNEAIGKGADAKRRAETENQVAAVRTDFANRGDTDTAAMNARIAAIRRMSEEQKNAADLERASGFDIKQRYDDQKQAISDAVVAAQKYGVAIDYREVLAANKDAWLEYAEAQDKAILATGGFMDGLKVALNEMAIQTQSAAQQMQQAFTQAVDVMNDTLAKVATEKHVRGTHDVRNQFSGAFRGIADNMAKSGLKNLEGGLLGASGVGKPDGTASNPWNVKVVGQPGWGIGGVNSMPSQLGNLNGMNTVPGGGGFNPNAGGGILGDVASIALQGMFADGTDSLIPGMPALVGEKGPELFVPPSSGSIVPNSKLGNLGGGHTFYIDARGSHDPAQTQAQIHNYMKKAAPQIVNTTMKAMHEQNARLPSRAPR